MSYIFNPPTLTDLGGVPTSRLLNTTAPVTGGGNLAADRTFALSYTPANKAGDTFNGQVTINTDGNATLVTQQFSPSLIFGSGVFATWQLEAHATTTRILAGRSQGTAAAPTALAGNAIFSFDGYGYNGSAYTSGRVGLRFDAAETWSTTANGTRASINVTTNGTTTAINPAFTVDNDSSLKQGGNLDTIFTSSRHPVLRSYTVATVPSATIVGQLIYVSNETGGAVPAFSDGTNWRRVTDRAIVA